MISLIQHAPVGIAVIEYDGRYEVVNPAYCELYGYREEEMLGHNFTMVFPAEARAGVLARHQAFLSFASPLAGEWTVVRRDGSQLTVMTESVAMPVTDGPPRRLVYVVDITHRKRLEDEIAEAHRFLMAILDTLAAQVCVLDRSGTIIKVNRSWREFGASNGAMTRYCNEGSNYLKVCDQAAKAGGDQAELAEQFAQLLRETLAGQRPGFQMEYRCDSPSERRRFKVSVSSMASGKSPSFVVVHDNVTELTLAKEALQQREALLLDLASSVPGAVFRVLARADGQWKFIYLSPGIEGLYGIAPQQALDDGFSLSRCIVKEDQAAHNETLLASVRSLQTWEHEFRIDAVDGQRKWLHAKATPKPADNGDVLVTGVLTDVSARKAVEARLRASEETYRNLFETVPQGIVYHDLSGRITAANPAALRILGRSLEQLLGLTSEHDEWMCVHEDGSDFPAEEHPVVQTLRTGMTVKDVVMGVYVPSREDYVWLLVGAIPVQKSGVLHEVYTSFEDISEQVRLSFELKRQATTDYLTGVANRRSFMEQLNREFARVQRHPTVHSCVLTLDLDHFKVVNDSHGHAVGDAVLVHVTEVLGRSIRSPDVMGRIGGEEFAIILPDTAFDEAMALAERLRKAVQDDPLVSAQGRLAVTISVGVSAMVSSDTAAGAVLVRADQALYQAKRQGRNTVCAAPS